MNLVDPITMHGHNFYPERAWQESLQAGYLAQAGVSVLLDLQPGQPSPVLDVVEGDPVGPKVQAAARALNLPGTVYVLTAPIADAAERRRVWLALNQERTILID